MYTKLNYVNFELARLTRYYLTAILMTVKERETDNLQAREGTRNKNPNDLPSADGSCAAPPLG